MLEQIINVRNREGVWTCVMLIFIFFSQYLSNEENLKLFGKCNNPNGHGHNYKGERKTEEILALWIRVKECFSKYSLNETEGYGQNTNALSLEWDVK